MMKNPKTGFESPAKAAAMEPVAIFASSLLPKPNQIMKNVFVFILLFFSLEDDSL